MALKSLYRVCEIKKLDLIFSSFSVGSQNHSYKNSIVFRLARHLCSSTSLVIIGERDTYRGKNEKIGYMLYIYMYVCMYGLYVCPLNARAGNGFS